MRTPLPHSPALAPALQDVKHRTSSTEKIGVKLVRAVASPKIQRRLDSFLRIITYTHGKPTATGVVSAQLRLVYRFREYGKDGLYDRPEWHSACASLRKGLALVVSVTDIISDNLEVPAGTVDRYVTMVACSLGQFHQDLKRLPVGGKALSEGDKRHLDTVFAVLANRAFVESALCDPALLRDVANLLPLIERFLDGHTLND